MHYLRHGARVIAVGSTPAKGAALLADATAESAGDCATFLQADLTSVAATSELVARIQSTSPTVDQLVLCAQRYRLFGPRSVTPEGFEHAFALGYLSRYVLSHGLRTALEAAPRPVILNVGTPGVPLGRLHREDLQLDRRYDGFKATLQAFRANDLLGAAYPSRYPDTLRRLPPRRGVDRHAAPSLPPAVARPDQGDVRRAGRVRPESRRPDDTPPGRAAGRRVLAYQRKRRLAVTGRAFDESAAARLHEVTRELIGAG